MSKRISLPLIFLLAAIAWINVDLFPAEGWALGTADMRALFYPWWEFVRNSLFQGRIPFWDTRHFAGTPFLHNPQIAFFYPPNWIVFALPINIGISFYYLLHLWLAGWGMARLVIFLWGGPKDQQPKILGIELGALAAGLAFMFGGFFAARIHAGHAGFLATHVWLPWLLVATGRGLSRKQWRYASSTALLWGLAILAGHTTTLIYLGMIWLFFVGWHTWLDIGRNGRFAAKFAAAALSLGLLLSSIQLWPTIQLILRSGRVAQGGYDFATRFSMPWTQLMTLVVGEWFGKSAGIGYWGAENFDELTAFAGSIAFLATILASVMWGQVRKPNWTLFFLILIAFGLMIAVGRNGFLYRLLYVAIPPFRVMRAPGRALFFFAFSAPVLLGWVVTELFNRPFLSQRILPKTLVSTIVLWLMLLLGTGAGWWQLVDADVINRRWHQLTVLTTGGALLITMLILLCWLVLRRPSNNWMQLGSLLFLVTMSTDLGSFGQSLVSTSPMTPYWVWFDAAAASETQTGRILPWGFNIFEQNGSGQLGLESVFGYNTLENGAVSQLAASHPDPRGKAFDILHATHVVSEGGLGEFTDSEPGLTALIRNDVHPNIRVYPRPAVLDYARLVNEVEIISEPETQYDRINETEFYPKKTAILSEEINCALEPDGAALEGKVEVVARSGGIVELVVDSNQVALLIVSEAAFPGWQAFVDGARIDSETAYTAIQAVCIPAGNHTVQLVFRPFIFLWGGLASLLGLLIAIFMWRSQ